MNTDPSEIAASYFQAWRAREFDTLRSILADEVEFSGPLADLRGREDVMAGLRRLAQITNDIVIHKRIADGPDVITWFELHTSVAPPAEVANWSQIDDGRITTIRVTFDPRSILQGVNQPANQN